VAPVIHCVHGILTDGKKSTDLVSAGLRDRGLLARDFNYPKNNVFTARFKRNRVRLGRELFNRSKDGDHVVAHSFGCEVVVEAMRQGACFSHVYLIAPAIKRDTLFPHEGAKKITVLYCEDDEAIKLTRWLWHHPFGTMGLVGYTGRSDTRVSNFEEYFIGGKRKSDRFHSAYFQQPWLRKWTDYIIRDLRR